MDEEEVRKRIEEVKNKTPQVLKEDIEKILADLSLANRAHLYGLATQLNEVRDMFALIPLSDHDMEILRRTGVPKQLYTDTSICAALKWLLEDFAKGSSIVQKLLTMSIPWDNKFELLEILAKGDQIDI